MLEQVFRKTNRAERKQIYNAIPWIVVLFFLPVIYFSFFPGRIVAISFICFSVISLLVFRNLRGFNYSDFDGENAFLCLLVFNVITLLRGFFNVEDSSDIFVLLSSDSFIYILFPFFVFFSDFDLLKRICRVFCTIGLLGCAFSYIRPPLDETLSFGHNISFMNVFLLTTPFLPKKYFIFFFLFAFLGVTFDLDRRSITINFLVVLCIVCFYKLLKGKGIRSFIYLCTIIIPITFLALGLSGRFNVFKYIESFNLSVNFSQNRQYNVDSRTSIYVDVFGDLAENNKMIVGLGARGKTHTSLVNNVNHDYWRIYKKGRSKTESGMLNYFQYGGFIGFFVISFFILSCAYYALFHSRNVFILQLGYLVCFKYIYSFIEDPISCNMNSLTLYLLLGVCLNRKLRNLNNKEMKAFLCEVFLVNRFSVPRRKKEGQ